jgi:hypothetical protein
VSGNLPDNIGDFDIAFAHEGMARAHSVSGPKSLCEKHLKLATLAGEQIKGKEDKDYFLAELETFQC